jgi:hypothetical protein
VFKLKRWSHNPEVVSSILTGGNHRPGTREGNQTGVGKKIFAPAAKTGLGREKERNRENQAGKPSDE